MFVHLIAEPERNAYIGGQVLHLVSDQRELLLGLTVALNENVAKPVDAPAEHLSPRPEKPQRRD